MFKTGLGPFCLRTQRFAVVDQCVTGRLTATYKIPPSHSTVEMIPQGVNIKLTLKNIETSRLGNSDS